jgi:hypothetical protein
MLSETLGKTLFFGETHITTSLTIQDMIYRPMYFIWGDTYGGVQELALENL